LEALRAELDLAEIMRLIERTARWVAPETFQLLPVWFPEYVRGNYFYKANWSAQQMNVNQQTQNAEHKKEGNLYANKALTYALGLRSDDRKNWSCCHIWGNDDPSYQQSNKVVQDHRFYSCVANMVLLPTPLKAFTDSMPEVKMMLRECARNLYGWHCTHESAAEALASINAWEDWSAYPKNWPRKVGDDPPVGVMLLNDRIRADVERREKDIKHDLEHAGPHYPRAKVLEVLAEWTIAIERIRRSSPER